MSPRVKAKTVESNPVEGDAGSQHRASRTRRGEPGGSSRPRLAMLLKRQDSRPTIHGMRKTRSLEQWVNEPRKWISLTTWNGQDFVVEDK